jgi:biotin carboxyl carrier protein
MLILAVAMVRAAPASAAPSAFPEEALLEIDGLLEDLIRLGQSGANPSHFHAEVVSRAVRAMAASAGAFWVAASDGTLRLETGTDATGAAVIDRLKNWPPHVEILEATLGTGQPRLILPRASLTGTAETANPTDFLLLVCPILVDSAPRGMGLIEIVQRAGNSPATEQGYLRLLAAFCDVTADFHRQRLLENWRDRAARVTEIEQFAERVHASLNVASTAAAFANEGRRFIGCDRLSVATVRRGRCQLRAISGQAEFDRRGSSVRLLEELIATVVAAGRPIWHGLDENAIPPQIGTPLQAYLDVAHPQTLAVIPLDVPPAGERRASTDEQMAMLVESFDSPLADDALRERVACAGRIGGQALRNALDHESVPLSSVGRSLQRLAWWVRLRNLPRTLLVAIAVAAGGLALAFVPAELEIPGRGALHPEVRRDLFAAADGVVSDVRVDHGATCRSGDPVVVMSRSQLDFEFSRVLGEIQTARKRLAGVSAARLESAPRTSADRDRANQLAADEEELKALLTSLEEQHAVLLRQQEELTVRSPIDGNVITWNVRELLEGRPVQKGQVLLTVAELRGPWVLEIEVPDDQIGHVLSARESVRPDLDVEFILATAPGMTHHGRIQEVSLAATAAPSEPAHVLVTVAFDRSEVPQLRPGATVVSRIHCGSRSVGYVWFHGLLEAVQKRLWF